MTRETPLPPEAYPPVIPGVPSARHAAEWLALLLDRTLGPSTEQGIR